MDALVSIITPMYNNESVIEKTIQSVINQTYTNWELILIDDCSYDKTTTIVNAFTKKDSRIKVYKHSTNKGAAQTRNLGTKKARGNYIAFLDADDWLEKDAVEELKKAISGTSNYFSFPYLNLHGEAKGVLKNQYNFFEQLIYS